MAWEEKKSLFLYFKEKIRRIFGADSELPGCAALFYVSEAIKPEVPRQLIRCLRSKHAARAKGSGQSYLALQPIFKLKNIGAAAGRTTFGN